MKKLTNMGMCVAIASLFLSSNLTFAQFQPILFSTNNSWRTQANPPVGAIGIGVFPNWTALPSALTINTNLLPVGSPTGEMFRTICPTGTTSYWRMLEGGTPRGFIYAPASPSNDLVIESRSGNSGGDILFNNGPSHTQMIITDGAPFPLAGNVGIGDNFLTPKSLLHQESLAFDNYHQFTNNSSIQPLTSVSGFRIGIAQNGIAELRQQENLPMDFYTNVWLNNTRKMRIWHDAMNNTRVGIGTDVNTPLTYLHIGMDALPASGARNWMDKGVLMYGSPLFSGSNIGTDNMYVGLRELGTFNQSDAIISWGNDPTSSPVLTDRLRFVFTEYQGNTAHPAHCDDGLEISRMVSDGLTGKIGFGGDGYSNYTLCSPPFPTPYNPYSNANVDPGNTVEINSPVTSASSPAPAVIPNTTTGYLAPNQYGGTGFSGLRFTDLTSKSSPDTDTIVVTTNYLSLDTNGDVIFVPGNGFGYCKTAPTSLSGDAGINLNGKNFYFEGQGPLNTNNVGIGIACGTILPAKFNVLVTTPATISGFGMAGRFVVSYPASGTSGGVGVYGESAVDSVDSNIGGSFRANGNPVFTNNIGVNGIATGSGGKGNIGVYGNATGIAGNTGVKALASGGTQNVGIYASAPGTVPSTAPPYPVQDYAGIFEGDVWVSGINNGSGYVAIISDERLKTDTLRFTQGINIIRNLQPFTYRYNGAAGFETQKVHTGLIAEQVAAVAPFAIDTVYARLDTSDTQSTALLAVKSDALTFTALNAIKELDSAVTKATSVPDAPVLISPADGTVGDFSPKGAAAFNWHSVSPGIILYRAQIATDNGFTNIVIDQSGIPDTTFSANFCDTVSTTYYWRVSAKNNAGTGAWSNVFSFTDTAKCGPLPKDTTIRRETAVAFNSTSDSQLKTNIAPVSNALAQVNALSGIYYNWLQTPGYQFDTAKQIGLIAQDVQQVVPQVVHTDQNGYLTLDYGRLAPLFVEALKELKAWKDSVQNATARTFAPSGNTNTQQIKLTLPDTPFLGDVRPNPNTGQAEIPYYLPDNISNAKIIFTDMLGRVINETIPETGYRSISIDTQDLPNGNYFYAFIINGNKIDSKTMVKTK